LLRVRDLPPWMLDGCGTKEKATAGMADASTRKAVI
jgi:hypothetical protein